MKTLPRLNLAEWLLAFDFDGTLSSPEMSPSVPREFFNSIRALRESHQAFWGINTGRSLMQTLEGIHEAAFPFFPDYIIAREREIYTPNGFGRWLPVKVWNKDCDKAHKKLFRKHRRLLKSIRSWIEKETATVWGEQEGEPAGMEASSVEEMNAIVVRLKQETAEAENLSFQRNGVYLRFSHESYHKGSALAEVGRLMEIAPERTFAIGDSFNDLDMLDRSIANSLACPANADMEVKEQISRQDGYIASANAGLGAIEALNSIFSISQKNTGGGNRTRTSEETGF